MAILEKANAVLTTLEGLGEATAQQIAERVDEPVSSTYRLLSSLTALGWIDPGSRRGQFRLGLLLMRIGGMLEEQLDVRTVCRPALELLRARLHTTSFLCFHRGTNAVCVERIAGRDVQSLAMRLGDSLPLYVGAAPLAILSHLPAGEQELILGEFAARRDAGEDMPPVERIRAQMATTRARGYSISDEDVTPGIAAIGAPVFNHRGELEGAISISGLREQLLADLPATAVLVVAAARDSSSALGFRQTAQGAPA